ncbi:Armadillo-like helical domain containing protein [Dorcoceras hygrometricum]|uniref:Armadillo-like helical domain containing protein n=1 Tax=Dorcoceras hygrometricum TaxID=472368 RepID=A0A2Z7AUN6_9LAMI|nr:Armadillo-like helical domain containing protein [Dorcoceras hygrometricum]
MLQNEFNKLAINAKVAGRLQKADKSIVSDRITDVYRLTPSCEEEINLRPQTNKGKTKIDTNEITISPFHDFQLWNQQEKGHMKSFTFKLRRSDNNTQKYIKDPSTDEVPLVATVSEDDLSPRRAWVLWVCLIEMDNVKFPFKFYQNSANGSFLLNTMTGKTTCFAEDVFERKRHVNKFPGSKDTRRKFCNMAHIGRWIETICRNVQIRKSQNGKNFRLRSDWKHFAKTSLRDHTYVFPGTPKSKSSPDKNKEDTKINITWTTTYLVEDKAT